MNGFNTAGWEDFRVHELAHKLIAQAEQVHEFTSTVARHPDERRCKHRYVNDLGARESDSTFSGTQFRQHVVGVADRMDQRANAAVAIAGSSGSSGPDVVRTENPRFTELHTKLLQVRVAKNALGKRNGDGMALLAQLEFKSASSPVFSSAVAELTTAMAGQSKFLSTLRAFLSASNAVRETDTVTTDMLDSVDAHHQTFTARMEGPTRMLKRMKALLA